MGKTPRQSGGGENNASRKFKKSGENSCFCLKHHDVIWRTIGTDKKRERERKKGPKRGEENQFGLYCCTNSKRDR